MKPLIAALLAFGLMGSAAQAATVFSDNFEVVGKGSKKNFNNFPQFSVSDGTVDYITTGLYKLSCATGSNGCVDLDGSTYDAGVMTSTTFTITAGTSYTISFDLAGNGRSKTSDSVTFGITGGVYSAAISDIAWNQAFTTYTYTFTATTSGLYSFYIGAAGGDNYGPLLDNVLITSADVSTVPLPATMPLLAGGLAAAGALLRRRKA